MGQIYGIKRNSDNKIMYVGQTIKNYLDRWEEHLREAKRNGGFVLHAALRKYNYNFTPILLEECDDNDLDKREIYWIDKMQTFVDKGGYNLTIGGTHRPDSVKHKVYQYDILGNYLKTFNSINEAAREINGHPSAIRHVLSSKVNTAYGFRWSTNFLEKLPPLTSNHTGRMREIGQFDLEDNLIQIFPSLKDACEQLHLKSKNNISSVLHGRRNKAYGYKWKFID